MWRFNLRLLASFDGLACPHHNLPHLFIQPALPTTTIANIQTDGFNFRWQKTLKYSETHPMLCFDTETHPMLYLIQKHTLYCIYIQKHTLCCVSIQKHTRWCKAYWCPCGRQQFLKIFSSPATFWFQSDVVQRQCLKIFPVCLQFRQDQFQEKAVCQSCDILFKSIPFSIPQPCCLFYSRKCVKK